MFRDNQVNTVHVPLPTPTHVFFDCPPLKYVLAYNTLHPAPCFSFTVALYCIVYIHHNWFNWSPFDGHLVFNSVVGMNNFVHTICPLPSTPVKEIGRTPTAGSKHICPYSLIDTAISHSLELNQFTPHKLHMKVYFSMASTQFLIF